MFLASFSDVSSPEEQNEEKSHTTKHMPKELIVFRAMVLGGFCILTVSGVTSPGLCTFDRCIYTSSEYSIARLRWGVLALLCIPFSEVFSQSILCLYAFLGSSFCSSQFWFTQINELPDKQSAVYESGYPRSPWVCMMQWHVFLLFHTHFFGFVPDWEIFFKSNPHWGLWTQVELKHKMLWQIFTCKDHLDILFIWRFYSK